MDVRLSPEQRALRDSAVQVVDRLAPAAVRDLDDTERIAKLDAAVIVPGHGPLTDAKGALEVRDYLVHVSTKAREAYDAGLSPADAARELPLGAFAAWGDAERIAVNVHTLYREWSGGAQGQANALELFGLMAELAKRRGARGG